MNNKYLIAGGIVIGVLAGAYFLIPHAKKPTQILTNQEETELDMSDTRIDLSPNAESSRYQDYSPERASLASNDRKVVLFFHASWCPTCKAAHQAFLEGQDSIPSDVLILKTDYDTQTDLKKKYDVNYQHTFVQIDSEGNQIQQWNGGDIKELLKRVQ